MNQNNENKTNNEITEISELHSEVIVKRGSPLFSNILLGVAGFGGKQ